ncbi:CinA family protein [Corticibacter populi]|uniref:CinA family protein n=1 Tax=Corticibacter populi TaxID=1550736 RepID=A0A3M6R0C4_9BURK|nr:CinA family protein [Corticibacter populi]RMX08329.1 CinA family protein [Corticibacter populi]RZS35617.1 nicotinamide-nucleotide amidase [Corticibacter populi]
MNDTDTTFQPAPGEVVLPIVQELANWLLAHRQMVATAESCTGGLVAAACTALAGSSAWFERGFVTYTNSAKHELLGVPAELITTHGAVSEPVARAMANGAIRHSRAQLAMAITGIAGPSGGSVDKPVGTVWFGWRVADQTHAEVRHFQGDRGAVRQAAMQHALQRMLALARLSGD